MRPCRCPCVPLRFVFRDLREYIFLGGIRKKLFVQNIRQFPSTLFPIINHNHHFISHMAI
jgi:hypothetical protein